jgi:hypothetical protein
MNPSFESAATRDERVNEVTAAHREAVTAGPSRYSARGPAGDFGHAAHRAPDPA